MKSEDFDNVVNECTEIIKKSLKSKAKEYAMENDDRFINFKRGAEVKGTTPEDVLFGYWLKHLVSIFDIIDKITAENKKTGLIFTVNPEGIGIPEEMVDEKIKDAINYLILLKGLLKERYHYGKIRKRGNSGDSSV